MKYILKFSYLLTCISLLSGLESCVKDRNDLATDFSTLQPMLEIRDNISGIGNDAGIANFGKATLNFGNDTTDSHVQSFYVNLASVNTLNHDITVTVGVDQAALDAYNSNPSNGTKFEMMPDSIYTLQQTQVTIPAGQRVALVSIQLTPSKIDPTKSYMLPVSITDAGGINISGNFGTIYYHLIGNPIAGSYTWDFTRWSVPDTSGAPDGYSFTGGTALFIPDDATTIEVPSGYYIQPRYILTFEDNNGVLSNFSVKLNDDDVATMAGAGVVITSGPVIEIADPVNKHFRFYYTTATRAVIDEYYKE
jgi:hypothetical protein